MRGLRSGVLHRRPDFRAHPSYVPAGPHGFEARCAVGSGRGLRPRRPWTVVTPGRDAVGPRPAGTRGTITRRDREGGSLGLSTAPGPLANPHAAASFAWARGRPGPTACSPWDRRGASCWPTPLARPQPDRSGRPRRDRARRDPRQLRRGVGPRRSRPSAAGGRCARWCAAGELLDAILRHCGAITVSSPRWRAVRARSPEGCAAERSTPCSSWPPCAARPRRLTDQPSSDLHAHLRPDEYTGGRRTASNRAAGVR